MEDTLDADLLRVSSQVGPCTVRLRCEDALIEVAMHQ